MIATCTFAKPVLAPVLANSALHITCMQPWDNDVHFVKSDNNFKDFSARAFCGNMFEVIGHSIYLAYANTCPTDIHGNKRPSEKQTFKGITLYTSIDGSSSFLQACLPVAVNQEGYEILSTQDGTGAIIIVDFKINNGFMDIPASSVYTAGPHHALFSLSLTDVYKADFGFVTDFARIEGLPVSAAKCPLRLFSLRNTQSWIMDCSTLNPRLCTFLNWTQHACCLGSVHRQSDGREARWDRLL